MTQKGQKRSKHLEEMVECLACLCKSVCKGSKRGRTCATIVHSYTKGVQEKQ